MLSVRGDRPSVLDAVWSWRCPEFHPGVCPAVHQGSHPPPLIDTQARSSAPGGPTLIKRALQLVLGASMLAVLSMLASRQLTSSQREPSAIRQVATLASQGGRKRRQGSTGKEAAIAGQSGAAPEAAEPQPAPRREAPSLARSQAETLIQRWLVRASMTEAWRPMPSLFAQAESHTDLNLV